MRISTRVIILLLLIAVGLADKKCDSNMDESSDYQHLAEYYSFEQECSLHDDIKNSNNTTGNS